MDKEEIDFKMYSEVKYADLCDGLAVNQKNTALAHEFLVVKVWRRKEYICCGIFIS